MRGEFVKFLLVGASNTVFSYLLYLLLLLWLSYMPAYSISYGVSILSSYYLNVRFVFRERVSLTSFLQFPLVYIVQYSLGAGTLWLLAGKFAIPPSVAMIGVIIITIPVTFIMSRFIIKEKKEPHAVP